MADDASVAGDHIGPAEMLRRSLWASLDGRSDLVERRILQKLEGGRIGGPESLQASNTGHVRHAEEDLGVIVRDTRRHPAERVRETHMIDPRHHEHALLAEYPRRGPIGQHDAPALQARAHTAAVDHRCSGRAGRELTAKLVRAMGTAELELRRNPVEANRVDLSIVLLHERARALEVPAEPAPQHFDAMLPECGDEVFVLFAKMYDETAFHQALPGIIGRMSLLPLPA